MTMTPTKFLSTACPQTREAALTTPRCEYCETTEGLRQHHDGGGYIAPDYICEDCFTGSDTGPGFDDLPLAPPTNLQRLEAAPSLSIYLTMWVAVEQELISLRLNGRFDEADAGQAEFDRICAEVGPRVRKQATDSIRIYSLAELAEFSKPATLDDVTSIVCADILSGSLGSYGKRYA